MDRADLVAYLDDYLHIADIVDYGPQGLQVETTNTSVKRIALAVDVSPAIIETAVAWQADMLLVHHGILWRQVERIVGPLGARVQQLMAHGLNLYAAHLPLDAHPEVGNNAVLAKLFGISELEWWCSPTNVPIGVVGNLNTPLTLDGLVSQVNSQLQTKARVLAHGSAQVQRLAILSGFGADKVADVKQLGADTYLTGETSHANFWAASDFDINIIFAGHYATETVGVQALGVHLVEKFGVEIRFFDFPTAM
ncbi:MAG: Nif3-like dinuclear metal center hexameric protein [Chloroflexi bacterium]|nr:Nif3-like dinuclear metal center hexameric protein [Chloroflexota bacterium]